MKRQGFKPKRDLKICITVTPQERNLINQAAAERNQTVASMIRDLAALASTATRQQELVN
jgi:uncharacterized protein (DUF1778 family)